MGTNFPLQRLEPRLVTPSFSGASFTENFHLAALTGDVLLFGLGTATWVSRIGWPPRGWAAPCLSPARWPPMSAACSKGEGGHGVPCPKARARSVSSSSKGWMDCVRPRDGHGDRRAGAGRDPVRVGGPGGGVHGGPWRSQPDDPSWDRIEKGPFKLGPRHRRASAPSPLPG